MLTLPSLKSAVRIGILTAAALTVFAQSIRYADWGNRFEGQERTPHAAPDYELRGFFAYRAEYSLSPEARLHVRFFLPSGESSVFVEAQEVDEFLQYHMRPKEGSLRIQAGSWCEFGPWPVSDVLRPLRLGPDKISILVTLGTPNASAPKLAPAIIYDAQFPAEVKSYTIYWSSQRRLKQLQYGIVGANSAALPGGLDPEHVVRLDLNPPGVEEGWATIRLNGEYTNSNTPLLAEYRFYHKRWLK